MNKIKLRKIKLDDTELIVKWRNKDFVKKNLYTQSDLTRDQHIWWFENKIEKGLCHQFIIVVQDKNLPIGTIFIKNIDEANKKGEFGIFIGEENELGKGYGTLAAVAILDYAFNKMKLNRVYLGVFADNSPAIKSYKKVGFKYEGTLRSEYLLDNEYKDVVLMSILKHEFTKLSR